MNKTSVLVLLLSFASQFNSTEAFISAESIGNWFLNALTNAATSIFNAIKNLATSIFNAIRDLTLELISDVFHSLSSASSTFKDSANKTISELLNVGEEGKEHLPSSMQFLINNMEGGPLPPEYHFAKANPEEEVNHLRYWISIINWGLIVYILISMILIAWFGFIVVKNRQLERRIIKMQ